DESYILREIGAARLFRSLRLFHLLKANEVILFQEFFLASRLEPSRGHLANEDLFAGPNVAQGPFATLAFDALKIDQRDAPAGAKSLVDRLQRPLRKLEMMVNVAD